MFGVCRFKKIRIMVPSDLPVLVTNVTNPRENYSNVGVDVALPAGYRCIGGKGSGNVLDRHQILVTKFDASAS